MNKRQRKKQLKKQQYKYSNLIMLALTNDTKYMKGFLEKEIQDLFKGIFNERKD